jgi:hypothetical protein
LGEFVTALGKVEGSFSPVNDPGKSEGHFPVIFRDGVEPAVLYDENDAAKDFLGFIEFEYVAGRNFEAHIPTHEKLREKKSTTEAQSAPGERFDK